MNWKVLIGTMMLVSLGNTVKASDTNGLLVAEIDGHTINLPVKCDSSTGMLKLYSDADVRGKSDSDGDGIYLQLDGIPSMGIIKGIFNIRGSEYKFVHKGELTLDKLVIEEMDVTRRGGTTYKIMIDLTCS